MSHSVFQGNSRSLPMPLSLWSLSFFYFPLQTHCPFQSDDLNHFLKTPLDLSAKGVLARWPRVGFASSHLLGTFIIIAQRQSDMVSGPKNGREDRWSASALVSLTAQNEVS